MVLPLTEKQSQSVNRDGPEAVSLASASQSGVDLFKIQKLLGTRQSRWKLRYSRHCLTVLDKISAVLAQSNEKGLAVSS